MRGSAAWQGREGGATCLIAQQRTGFEVEIPAMQAQTPRLHALAYPRKGFEIGERGADRRLLAMKCLCLRRSQCGIGQRGAAGALRDAHPRLDEIPAVVRAQQGLDAAALGVT